MSVEYACCLSPHKPPVQIYTMYWVASKLQCGLGNRLFQLAAAFKQSIQWNIPLVFAMPYCSPAEHGDFETIFKLFPSIERLWKAEAQVSIDQEGVFEETLLPSEAPAQTVLLKGMWQAASFVLDDFRPTWVENPELLERWCLTSEEQRANTVFLHVRLGDYKILPHHQVNLLAYFVRAMDMFPNVRFLIFSDSLEEVKTYSIFSSGACVFVDEPDEYNTLYLMSKCGGAITANSTFSWWGAFFARQQAKGDFKACMPDKWFETYSESTDTIYPPWATVIPV